MNDYIFSAILLFSSFVAGWILYFLVAILFKRRGSFLLKRVKVNLRPLKSPLRFLITCLVYSRGYAFIKVTRKS